MYLVLQFQKGKLLAGFENANPTVYYFMRKKCLNYKYRVKIKYGKYVALR